MVLKKRGHTLHFTFTFTFIAIFYFYCTDKLGQTSLPDRHLSISSVSFALRRCVCMIVTKKEWKMWVKNDQLHFTDIVFLCTHMSFLIEDSVRWVAGKSGDWQVTGLSLIRHWPIIEVLTLTFSAINLSQTVCVDFIFLWQGLWYRASGQVRTGYRVPVETPATR